MLFGIESTTLRHVLGDIRTDVLAPVGLALALFVTMQVLLSKRDIGSAIGWIGLAWLSPLLGCALYFVFGVNRVERRARRIRRDVRRGRRPTDAPSGEVPEHLEPLEIAARTLTSRTATTGDGFELLRNGDDAYPQMLDAIGAAETSVVLTSYIFFDEPGAGARFIDALIAAHERGVAVRVLVDGIGSGYFRSRAYHRLHAAGVPVGRFMHSTLPWRMPFLNLRSHKKLLVLDGRLAFTGGMNISRANLIAENPPEPVRDLHFRVQGPVVAQLMEDFCRDWNFVTDEELDGDRWYPELTPGGQAVSRVVTSGPDEDVEKIFQLLLCAVASARRSIRVMTPYFLPDDTLVTALSLAATRGIDVDVVVPEVSDHRMIDWAVRAHISPALAAGVRIWRNPPPFEHSKLLVIDGRWALIGSANWDMRSLRLNFELNVEIYRAEIAERLEAEVLTRRHKAFTVEELAGRPYPIRLRDAAVRLLLPYL